jgi:hypothetical protein
MVSPLDELYSCGAMGACFEFRAMPNLALVVTERFPIREKRCHHCAASMG